MSGGFPHSDIHGSKPIPGSPWLNAGYHVLHRLLLPRHPPNALIALDLIQKKTGFPWRQKLHLHSQRRDLVRVTTSFWLVYLTWKQYRIATLLRQVPPYSGQPAILMCISLHDVNRTEVRTLSGVVRLDDRTHISCARWSNRPWWSLSGSNRRPPACKAGALPAELRPRQESHWWVEEDSNLRPYAYQAYALTT